MAMLVSQDLLNYWQKMIAPPAQLCCARVVGSDTQFVLRVRHADVYLDLPLTFTLGSPIDIDDVGNKLAAMGAIVVKPGSQVDNWCPQPQPQMMHPLAYGDPHQRWKYDVEP